MIVAPHFIINTLFQRGVLRRSERQNRFNFNGFCALSKTAEAVRIRPPHSYTPPKRGVNEKNPLRKAMFAGLLSGTDGEEHDGRQQNGLMARRENSQ